MELLVFLGVLYWMAVGGGAAGWLIDQTPPAREGRRRQREREKENAEKEAARAAAWDRANGGRTDWPLEVDEHVTIRPQT